MEKNRKVSVLMSVYYKEKPEYLEACLESIIQQTYQPDEIVLVKDGPLTEELEHVLEQFVSKNPQMYKLVPLEKNVGLGKALAIGVEAASYELIARMDTDDIALPERLEKQRNYFQMNPETAIVGSDIIEFEGSIDQVVANRIVPHTHEEIYEFAKRRNPFNHMTVMYRKDSVLEVGNYQPLNGYEDYYLWVRMLEKGLKAYNFAEVLVYARGGNLNYS
ncbi:Glycosyl transferase family 2 [Trichococcus flocculiformis]|uniref:glycosyltransferase n=1 Tax=Trichococcus TaxID=82802 RepID=UPI0007A9137F|nr:MULTISPECIES: glycosyltransferase [Trichococcus]CZR10824.1 nucleotide-diphospho-sugar transferases [Trichococcus sp. ES5]SHG27407.1 Glycosyl transferase family 2 [Trichococcus flocculiformis]